MRRDSSRLLRCVRCQGRDAQHAMPCSATLHDSVLLKKALRSSEWQHLWGAVKKCSPTTRPSPIWVSAISHIVVQRAQRVSKGGNILETIGRSDRAVQASFYAISRRALGRVYKAQGKGAKSRPWLRDVNAGVDNGRKGAASELGPQPLASVMPP